MKIGITKTIKNDDHFSIFDMDDDGLSLIDIYFKNQFKNLSIDAKFLIIEDLASKCKEDYEAI